jgi:hypothetical protein
MTQPFAILALYLQPGYPHIVHAEDETAARLLFHRQHPGWEGTIFKVITQDDIEPAEGAESD